ncbi:MAG: ABC transporter permease [Roseivirga sp.]
MSVNHKTPGFANWLLKVFCREDYREEVQGDLQEVFDWRVEKQGLFIARLRHCVDIMSAIRFYRPVQEDRTSSGGLLFSFFKSALRNFRRHWGYASLNLFGLGLCIAMALLIMQHVSDELNYDRFSQSDTMYRVENDYVRFGETIYESAMTFSGVAPAMLKELPEVEKAARLYNIAGNWGGANILTSLTDETKFYQEEAAYFADKAITDLFDLELLAGANQLEEPNTLLITREMAAKYFGSVEAAVGQVLRLSNVRFSRELVVTGVIGLPDFNIQVDVQALISYPTLYTLQGGQEQYDNNWGNYSFLTYIKVREGTSPRSIEEKMKAVTLKYKKGYTEKDEQGNFLRTNTYFLTPVQDVHLYSAYQNEVGETGNHVSVQALMIIAVFILIIAWVNYVNLSTARAIDRAKEVGLRKVFGAQRSELIGQFFTEAVLLNLMALLLALGMVVMIQPTYNAFIEKELSLYAIDWAKYGPWAGLVFSAGVALSGLYPAFAISRYRSVEVFRGKVRSGRGVTGLSLRRGLVVFQLFITSVLIIGTFTISQQLVFMHGRDLGFNKEQVLILKSPTVRSAASGEERSTNIRLFKNRVRGIAGVEAVGTSTEIPGKGILRGIAISPVAEDESRMRAIERVLVDDYFLDILSVNFVAGESFDAGREYGTTPLVLNESAAEDLGFSDPQAAIGQVVYEFNREPREVVGVIADYHHESLNRAKDPMYFVRNEAFDAYYALRLKSDNVTDLVNQVETAFGEVFPGNPPEYFFLDSLFDAQYRQDELNARVFGVFALMAVLVACLGLYGLSSFAAMQRTKEVGVRKVLGASIPNLFMLLFKEVFLLVVLGFLIALPLSYLGIDGWLSNFAYRMETGVLLFLLPLLIVLVITLLATARQIIRVSVMNPVKSLRYE